MKDKKYSREVIKVSRLTDDQFKVFLDKSLTIGELELYTSRLAYYLSQRWTKLQSRPLNESTNAVSLAMLEHMNEWCIQEKGENDDERRNTNG